MAALYKVFRGSKGRILIRRDDGEGRILCPGIVPLTGDGELGSIGANIDVVGAGNGVIRAFHQGRAAVLHDEGRLDRGAVISLVWNRVNRDTGDVLLADCHFNISNGRIAVAAIALDLVVHGVGLGVLALGDCSTPIGIIQAVLHGAIGGGARINQFLIAAVILQALGGGGIGDRGRREAVGLGEGLGQDDGSCVRADLGVAGGGIDGIRKALAGVCSQGDSGVVELLGLGGSRAGDRGAGGIGAFKPLHLGDGIGCAAINGADEVQRLARYGLFNGSSNTADGGFGDGDGFGRWGGNIGNWLRMACVVNISQIKTGYAKRCRTTCAITN